MGDPFRQYFLESIENTLARDANEESLLALLRFVSPSLKLDELLAMEPRERSKIMKVLKTRIHPDKHPQHASVTTIFQNVQNFYDECVETISTLSSKNKNSKRKRRKRQSSTQLSSVNQYPQRFNVFERWPIANISISTMPSSVEMNDKQKESTLASRQSGSHPLPPNNIIVKKVVPPFQAYKCIHARGSLAHGKPITKYRTWNEIQKASDACDSVYDVFDKFGGTKELDSVDSIKEELMNRGPVVSVSFRLLAEYLKQLDVGENAFAKDLIGCVHELLIVGWCLTPFGEAWQVRPLIDDVLQMEKKGDQNSLSLIQIGFGQFAIDDIVVAPDSNLEQYAWESGPYFDSDFSEIENWRSWEEMDLPINETDLKSLAKCFKNGFYSGESFVLRDQTKKAHSASYKIKNIKWVDKTQERFVTIYRQGKF